MDSTDILRRCVAVLEPVDDYPRTWVLHFLRVQGVWDVLDMTREHAEVCWTMACQRRATLMRFRDVVEREASK